jgi:hypothetical protein
MNNYQHILQKPGNLNFENNFLIEFKFHLIEYKLKERMNFTLY